MDKLKAYLPLLVLIVGIYVGMKVIPPYFDNWQFADFVENEARQDTYNTKPEADIRHDVMRSARDNNIPITDDMLTVRRLGAGATGVYISTHYVVHIDLPVHPFDLEFNVDTKNVNPVAR